MKKDYYKILGVKKDTDAKQIKKSYHTLALKFHPDRAPADKQKQYEDKFKEVAEAYEVLSDPKKRAEYDNPASNFSFGGFRGNSTIEDIMRNIMRNGGGNPFAGGPFRRAQVRQNEERAQMGRDVKTTVMIDFEEMVKGCSKEVIYNKPVTCEACDGNGYPKDYVPKKCKRCNGKGSVENKNNFMHVSYTCPECGGMGTKIEKSCETCSGQGLIGKRATVDVAIPAGIANGSIMRCAHAGGHGAFSSGDLYIYVSVNNSDKFKRINNLDIESSLKINFIEAILGCEKEIETVYNKKKTSVPPGTQHGDEIKLQGSGIKGGDQIVKIEVEIPKNVNDRQKELLEGFYDASENERSDESHR